MNIVILNGSPKNISQSLTAHHVYYIFKNFPGHNYRYLNIGQNIEKLEKNNNYFQHIINYIKNADAIVWACPVYVTLIPYQFKKFIELIFDRKQEYAFQNKFTASITTSIKFYDHHTHYYLHGICDDLNMKYVGYYSADSDDLFKKNERKKLSQFGRIFFESIANNWFITQRYPKIIKNNFQYQPGNIEKKISTAGKKIIILSSYDSKKDKNLTKMVQYFKNLYDQNIEEVNLNEQNIKWGCQGCHVCGYNNECVLKNKDDFYKIFTEKLLPSDIIIFASTIKDRYFNANFKKFFDRCFFMNHVPFFLGKQTGIIISGKGNQIHYLIDNILAISFIIGTNSIDGINDEVSDSKKIDQSLKMLAEKAVYFAENKYQNSDTFLKVGGRKIFRDAIWGRFRLVLQADHRYYKKYNFYDFPLKKIGYYNFIKNNFLILLSKFPYFRKKIYFGEIKKRSKKYKKSMLD